MASLNDAYTTLRRAGMLLGDLRAAVAKGVPLSEVVPLERHPRNENKIRYKMSNPLREVSTEVGVIVGQYRAVLDQLIYALIELRTGNPPKHRSQFPICAKAEDFRSRIKPDLNGLLPMDVERIEKLQPYNGATWTLRIKQLAEEHKHRKLIGLRAEGGAAFLQALQSVSIGSDSSRAHSLIEASYTLRFR